MVVHMYIYDARAAAILNLVGLAGRGHLNRCIKTGRVNAKK